MMCYKDRWWCPNADCKKFHECDRAFTDAEKAKAEACGLGDYVDMPCEPKKLECYEPTRQMCHINNKNTA